MSDWVKRILAFAIFIGLVLGEYALILQFNQTDSVPPAAESGSEEIIGSETVNKLDLLSNRYTHPDKVTESIATVLTTDGYTQILSNQQLELWMNESTCDLRIVNLESGYVWGGIDEATVTDLNKRWKKTASSLITVDYLDQTLAESTLYLADPETKKTWKVEDDRLTFTCYFPSIDLDLSFFLSLEENRLLFCLNNADLSESSDYPVTGITLMPFFGVARLDETNGYFFLPDGSGALMRFDTGKEYISSYNKRIYGSDAGIDSLAELGGLSDIEARPTEFMIAQPDILMPVYGVVHGPQENAFMVRIDEGDTYASILADAAGPRMNYHYIRTRYIYRQTYVQPTSQNGSGVRVFQEDRNPVDIRQVYTFLTGEQANYTGMAVEYREYLIRNGFLKQNTSANDPSLHLNIIASVRDKGFLANTALNVTTADEILSISDDISTDTNDTTLISLQGVLQGGYGGENLINPTLGKVISSPDELSSIASALNGNRCKMLILFDPVRMTDDQYTLRTDIATRITQQPAVRSSEDTSLLYPETWYRKNKMVYSSAKSVLKLLGDGTVGAAVGGIGEMLYSDYQKGEGMSREEAMSQDLSIAGFDGVEALVAPAAYLWEETETALNMPESASQYLFITDTVPFVQIVLHGNIALYGPYANETGCSQSDILRYIEYAQHPSFTITGLDNYSLRNSAVSDISSSNWAIWSSEVVCTRDTVSKALNGLDQYRITEHCALADGLIRVAYENGTRIYVNYTMSALAADGIDIPALNYLRIDQ